MENIIEPYFNEKNMDKLLQLVDIIESSHQLDIKMLDVINNDTYNHMNASGLFDYAFIERGHSAAKGVLNRPSQMNLVFYFYLSIIKDLKAFGLTKVKLLKVKSYLFEEFDVIDYLEMDTKALTNFVKIQEFKNNDTRIALLEKIESGKFLENLKGKKVSRLFLSIFNLISISHDIQLFVDVNADAMLVDELELNSSDMIDLAKDSRIIIPLKQYLVKFVGEYFQHDFVSRAKVLSSKDIMILEQLKKNDIDSITVKFYKGVPNIMEVRKQKKIQIQSRLSEVLLKGGFADIIIKTKQGSICYSQLTTKTKL